MTTTPAEASRIRAPWRLWLIKYLVVSSTAAVATLSAGRVGVWSWTWVRVVWAFLVVLVVIALSRDVLRPYPPPPGAPRRGRSRRSGRTPPEARR